jgi:hypothetical protein
MLNTYQQGYPSQGYPSQLGYPSQQGYLSQGYPSQQGYYYQQGYSKDDINKFNEMQIVLQKEGSFSQSKYSKLDIDKFYKMQQMQQMQQYQILTPQNREDMMRYYNIINSQLQNILSSDNKNYIDPFHLLSTISSSNDLTKEQMKNFFKHLLYYTYRASASEISNHLEVNKQLDEIKQVLLKLAHPTPTTL